MRRHLESKRRLVLHAVTGTMLLACVLAPFAFAQRTTMKPGWNLFSPQQDVELGQQVAQDAEKKLAMLNNRQVDDYLNRLGKKLAAHAPGEKYPYQFKCVNDPSINAFALPGGFLYVNRGTIEAAENEAELAGVIGHEIGHVAMRHGTNQASKSYLAQAPLALLGAFAGSNSVPAILAQIGTSFAANSILLKYSRDDERQSDLLGAQILYDAGYDPRYVAQFFEKLETGNRGTDFFSSHPSPDNRIRNINNEISKLGPVPGNTVNDTREFQSIQRLLRSLPAAPQPGETLGQPPGDGQFRRPSRPSGRLQMYDGEVLSLRHPDNWRAYESGLGFAVAPEGGIVGSGNGYSVAYGAIMEVHIPDSGSRSRLTLAEATDQWIANLRRSNPNMRMSRDRGQITVGGKPALSRILTNDSPMGGRETDWVITVLHPEGLVSLVFAVPEGEFSAYEPVFQKMLDSISF